MTEQSLYWSDGVGDGGPYSQDQLRLFAKMLGGPAAANEGVVGGHLNSLRATSSGNNNITGDTGQAIVDGTLYENDASKGLTVSSPTGGTTGVRLSLRKIWAARQIRLTATKNTDGNAAIPSLVQIDGTTWDIPIATFTITTGGAIAALADVREFTRPAFIEFQHEEAGAVLTAGIKARLEVPADIEVVGWTLLGDQSGTIQYDIWVSSYASYPPTNADSITGSNEPALSSATKAQGTVSGWGTLKLTKGTVLFINADSSPTIANVTGVTLVLRGYRA